MSILRFEKVLIEKQRTLADIEPNVQHPAWIGSHFYLCSRTTDNRVYLHTSNDKYISKAFPTQCRLYEKSPLVYKKFEDMKDGESELIQSECGIYTPFIIVKGNCLNLNYNGYFVVRPVYGELNEKQ